jgi:hypothetical protein
MAAGELDRSEEGWRGPPRCEGEKSFLEEFCVIDALGWFYDRFYRFLLLIETRVVEELCFEFQIVGRLDCSGFVIWRDVIVGEYGGVRGDNKVNDAGICATKLVAVFRGSKMLDAPGDWAG